MGVTSYGPFPPQRSQRDADKVPEFLREKGKQRKTITFWVRFKVKTTPTLFATDEVTVWGGRHKQVRTQTRSRSFCGRDADKVPEFLREKFKRGKT